MPTITICSSANFYKEVVDVEKELQDMGFETIIPYTAGIMKESGDFNVSHYKTWFGDKNDYHKKTDLMLKHFDKIAEGDAILVINNEKHGVANYIGGNVLMEMAIALYLKKPIYLFNEIPSESSFLEEIVGMFPVVLHGDIKAMAEEYKKLTPARSFA